MSRACCDRAWCVCGHAPYVESSGKEPKQLCPDSRDSASAFGDSEARYFCSGLAVPGVRRGSYACTRSLTGLANSRWKLQKRETIDTAAEARKTTPKHEFGYLHDVGRLREWLKQNSCIENICRCGHYSNGCVREYRLASSAFE